jgi:hypothetical protein
MLFIKVKRILRPKEIDIDKYSIIIIKWQRCRGGGTGVTVFTGFQDWKPTFGCKFRIKRLKLGGEIL